jgi:hypothetical protein
MWGVGRQRILTLIHNGELRATNVAINRLGRPRYLVSIEDIETFDRCRQAFIRPPVRRRQKRRGA